MRTDIYGQGVQVAQLTDPPDAATLAANIADVLAGRSIMRFTSASARTAALTGAAAPAEGMVSWLQDTNRLYVYDGTSWIPTGPHVQMGTLTVSFTNLDSYAHTSVVTFPQPFSTTPWVSLKINSALGVTARWIERPIEITPTSFRPFVFASVDGNLATWTDIQLRWTAMAP